MCIKIHKYYTHTHIFISTLRDNSYSPKNKLTKPTLKSKTDDMHTSYCCMIEYVYHSSRNASYIYIYYVLYALLRRNEK